MNEDISRKVQADLKKSAYFSIKLRLYFGEENFDRLYDKYLDSIIEDEGIEDIIDTANDYGRLTKYIENQSDEDRAKANNYWEANQEGFIELLKDYINASFQNEIAKKKYLYKLINENKTDSLHCFFELIQNADDCKYENKDGERKFTIDFSDLSEEKTITVSYNEKGMNHADIISLTSFNESTKAKNTEQIGEKGQGFKTVFYLCDWVEIVSGGYSFRYNCTFGNEEADITIENIKPARNIKDTQIVMHLRENDDNACDKLLEKYGFNEDIDNQNAFLNCPIMFTKNLNSMCIKRDKDDVYEISNSGKDNEFQLRYKHNDEEISIDYIRYENSVTFSEDEWKSRYGDDIPYKPDNNYKIYIAAPKNVKKNAEDSKISKGRLYTYLPTEQIIHSPVNIHFPAFLDSSRSTFGTCGNKHIAWNERLVRDFFAADGWYVQFFELMKTKAESGELSAELIDYLPPNEWLLDNKDLETFFDIYRYTSYNMKDEIPAGTDGDKAETDIYRRLKIFKSKDGKWRTGSEIWTPDDLVKDFDEAFFEEYKKYADEKYPTKYCEAFVDNSYLKKLTGYEEISLKDADKVEILNKIMNPDIRKLITQEVIKKNTAGIYETSIYLPENRQYQLSLKIFPRLITDNSGKTAMEYCAADEDDAVWVYSDESSGTPGDSFIHVCPYKKTDPESIFVNVGLISYKVKKGNWSVSKCIIDYLKELPSITDKHLRDTLSFFAAIDGSYSDWYEFGKDIFSNHSGRWISVRSDLLPLMASMEKTNDTDFENKKYTLLVLALIQTNSITINIDIPLNEWSDELMNLVIDADNDDKLDKNNIRINYPSAKIRRTNGLFEDYETYAAFQELTVCVGENALPEGRNFFHYNKMVVLRNTNNNTIAEAVNSILEGVLGAFTCSNQIKEIWNSDSAKIPFSCKDDVEKLGTLLMKNLAYEYHTSLIGQLGNEEQQSEAYGKNIIAYELVQNADDCHKRAEELAEKTGEPCKLGDTLAISYDDNSRVSLEYPDAGFSPKDLIGLCTRQNSANSNKGGNTTGKKGTGFKSIFRDFDMVYLNANFFNILLSVTEYPAFSIDNDGVSFTGGKKEYEKKPLQPIPSFGFTDNNQKVTALNLYGDEQSLERVKKDLLDFRTYLFTDSFKRITYRHDSMKSSRFSKGSINELIKTNEGDTLTIERRENSESIIYKFFRYTGRYFRTKTEETVTVLFPDQDTILLLMKEKNPQGKNAVIYCTLPLLDTGIKDSEKPCFFVNAPYIECDAYRVKPQDGEIEIIQNGIFNAFEEFAKAHPQIAYHNYPVGKFFELFKSYDIYFTRCKFIPVENGELISIDSLKKSVYTLDYKDVKDFTGLLQLYREVYKNTPYNDEKKHHQRRIGKLMLMHYEKYTGKNDCTPDTPVQTLIDTDEEIAGYSNTKILKNILAAAFGMNTSDFSIDKSMFNQDNVRSDLFVNDEMDDFAREVIKNHDLSELDLFTESSKLHWNDEYFEVFKNHLKQFSTESVSKENNKIDVVPFMHFDKESGLPKELKDLFEQYKECNEDIADKQVINGPDLDAVTIIDNAKYYESKLPLLFWSADGELVIFGKKAFKTLLGDLFGLKNEKSSIDLSKPVYSLPKVRGYGFSEELTDKKLFIVAAESFPQDADILSDNNWTPLMSRTDFRFTDDTGETHCYHWKGYGAKRLNDDTVCPVCNGRQFSTADTLEIYEVGASKLPLLMCKSCAKYYGSEKVYVYAYDKTTNTKKLLSGNPCGYIAENREITLELNIKYDGETTPRRKTIDVFLTTPHRILIYKKYKK